MCILTVSIHDPLPVPVFVSWTTGAEQAACNDHSNSNQDSNNGTDDYVDPVSKMGRVSDKDLKVPH
jgi:hypothetical protein